MNSLPIVLRLLLGVVTPASAPRNSVRGINVDQRDVVVSAEQRHDLSASPSRISPWSTKTQVS